MKEIQPYVPFNPFEGMADDTDPDEVLGIALQEKAEASDDVEFIDCSVLFPAREESRIIPIRGLSGGHVPSAVVVRNEGYHFDLINLTGLIVPNGDGLPRFVCIGKRNYEQTRTST